MSAVHLLPLLVSATAIGLSPYAALAGLGLATQLGLVAPPAPLAGLASPIVWSPLAILAAIQGSLSRLRTADLVSGALHTLISPLAAVLFSSAPLAERGDPAWAVAVPALVMAVLVHLYVQAIHTAAWTAGPVRRVGGFTIVQSLGAALLVTLAWIAPAYAAAWATLIVLAPVPWLPRLLGAAALPSRALIVLLSRPTRLYRWHSGWDALPKSLRQTARDHLAAVGGSLRNVRTAPVTLARWRSRWPYVRGWLVHEAGHVPLFLHRRRWTPEVLRLEAGPIQLDHGLLVETLEVQGRRPYSLCTDGGAPPAPAILAAVEAGRAEAGT